MCYLSEGHANSKKDVKNEGILIDILNKNKKKLLNTFGGTKMLAILYLTLCLVYGISLITLLIPDVRRLFAACSPSKKTVSQIPTYTFSLSAGFITGMLLVTAFNYYVTLLMSRFFTNGDFCKRLSVLITFAVFVILIATNLSLSLKRNGSISSNSSIPEYKNTIGSTVYYGISTVTFTVLAAFLMFYTYRISDGFLLAGFSTFSDLSPHTAMVSSFGVGFNFPTQYMHFSGDGIQYHFFFYFFCGMLEYLGLPIDWAINIPSIAVMVCAFELMGLTAVLLFRRRAAFVTAPLLVLFRSSFNVFFHLKELTASGLSYKAAIESILHSSEWYEVTPYDSWGIWAVNVYPNQRHLMLGVSCILILLLLTIPFVRRMGIRLLKAENKDLLKTFAATKEAWLWAKNDPMQPLGHLILASLIVAVMPFFHGSALIAVLLVLFVMAIVSESRIIYAAIAAVAVLSSFIQTAVFAGGAGNVVKFQSAYGFVAEDKTPLGIAKYLWIVTGLTLVLSIAFAVFLLVRDILKKKPVYRSLLALAFMAPLVFAFNCQVSLEMLANHKFIQISLILLDIFVAGALSYLFVPPVKKKDEALSEEENKGRFKKSVYILIRTACILLAVILILPLTATGVSEWATYINRNRNYLTLDTESELVAWIMKNTDPDDVFLTPQWAMDRFYLAGRPAYYGHAYYAWSAGHDTRTREQIYYWLISGCNNDIEEFTRYCKEREIKYLIYDPSFYAYQYPAGVSFNAEFFSANLRQVAYFSGENGTIIYEIY